MTAATEHEQEKFDFSDPSNQRLFAMEAIALQKTAPFDEYVELRVKGYPRDTAVIEAFNLLEFGHDIRYASAVGAACDANPYVKRKYKEVLESKDARQDLWTQNESVNELLRLIRDPRVRDATRLNAIVQLNVLCGYVQLDDTMKRRVDRTISDFKRQHAEWVAAGSPGDPRGGPEGTKAIH